MPRIYDPKYPGGFIEVDHINPYLLPGPDILVEPRATPFFRVPSMIYGNKPTDDGNFLLTPEEKDELIKRNPLAEKWIRPFVGALEFIRGKQRFCLWLEGCPPDELRKMPLVYERVKNVREFRLKSKDKSTRRDADKPMLFQERRQPTKRIRRVKKDRPKISVSREFFTRNVLAGRGIVYKRLCRHT